jgi:Ca-activated chloride channel family protein
MTRFAALLSIALALGAPQTFKSGTEGVRVDVLVTDGRTPVAGLSANDFELRDNGVLQRIDAVRRGDVPLSVVLALDTSASVEGDRLAHLRTVVSKGIRVLGPSDRVALLTFDEEIVRQSDFVDAGSDLLERTRVATAGGSSSVHDAAYAAMMLRDSRPGRALVVLLSDGRDTASWLSAEAVLRAARRTDVVVYAVQVDAGPTATPNGPWTDMSARFTDSITRAGTRTRPDFLKALANETGGRVFDASSTTSGARLAEALSEFKSRYLLTYTPTGVDRPGWHAIDVKVKRAGVKITARRGYEK